MLKFTLVAGYRVFNIVGLPETAVKESKDRVRGAILNSGFEFPRCRITINLAPADLPKHGSRYDLPIAIGVLAANKQIEQRRLPECEFAAELALGGDLRPVRGMLAVSLAACRQGRKLVVAVGNAAECALIEKAGIIAIDNLLQLTAFLNSTDDAVFFASIADTLDVLPYKDLAAVLGQERAKRALEIAAAGEHSLLMSGPPGTGKTLLANCLLGILPNLCEEQAVETAAVQSLSIQVDAVKQWRRRPFRNPPPQRFRRSAGGWRLNTTTRRDLPGA